MLSCQFAEMWGQKGPCVPSKSSCRRGGGVSESPAMSVQSCTCVQRCLAMAENRYSLLPLLLLTSSMIAVFPAVNHICRLHLVFVR